MVRLGLMMLHCTSGGAREHPNAFGMHALTPSIKSREVVLRARRTRESQRPLGTAPPTTADRIT